MKAAEVMRILRISRPTLCRYVKTGVLKVKELPTGRYEYDDASVYGFLNRDVVRNTYIYARVSERKQQSDLENQIVLLKQFCFNNGWQLNGVYQDVASGITFDKRKEFYDLLNEVLDGRVERVVVMHEDRLSRTCFGMLRKLFDSFKCQIVVVDSTGSIELDKQDFKREFKEFCGLYSGCDTEEMDDDDGNESES